MDSYQKGARSSPYPNYPPQPRPSSHEQPGLPRSSRSIIEGDYTIAQTMPKHPRDQQPPSSSFPRTIDPHRRESTSVDPRLDPRSDPRALYPQAPRGVPSVPYGSRVDPRVEVRGDPRAELPGARGDPRAEIPGARGDPRAEMYRDPRQHVPDPRTVDHRAVGMMDPRSRAPQLAYPAGYPDPRSIPRSRSPPRPHPQASAPSPSGSIISGRPKPREEGAGGGYRHPEVSITKSLPGGSGRPEGYAANLDDLAQLAETRQRLPDVRNHGPGVREGRPPQGQVAMMDPRAAHYERERQIQAKAAAEALGPPRGPSREAGGREAAQRMLEQQQAQQQQQQQQAQAQQQAVHDRNKQQEMIARISQMSEQDRQAYLDSLKNSARSQPDHMSAASLIDLIITHQINRTTVPPPGGPQNPNPRRSPAAPVDGKESPSKPPSHSPSVSVSQLEVGAGGSGVRTSPGTMGEHIENMISKEVGRGGTGSPYPGTSSAEHEHWKRRGFPGGAPEGAPQGYRPPSQPRPPSASHPGLSTDERVIQRVVQNSSPGGPGRPDKPPSRGMHEAISPPTSAPGYPPHTMYPGQAPIEPAMAKFFATARRKEEAERAAAASRGAGAGVSHFDDYVKYKITEVMKNEKAGAGGAGPSEPKPPPSHALSMGPPHKRPLETEARGSPSEHGPGPESPNKRYKRDESAQDMPDSPESGDMVIDESARPDSAHSQKTNSPAQIGRAHV